jgi:hypothetical protein
MRDDRYNRPDDLYAHLRFANKVQPGPQQWLWPNRIPIGKLTLLVGEPGLGKSLLVADLAARVSAGLPWPDSPNPQSPISNLQSPPSLPPSLPPEPRTLSPGPSPPSPPSVAPPITFGVVLVCPEDGTEEVLIPRLTAAGANLKAVCILEGATDTYLPHATTHPPSLRRPVASSLSSAADPEPSVVPFTFPAHANVLDQAIRSVDVPRLVVIDSLHAVLSPDAHGRAEFVVARLAESARRYNVAVVAVCHLAKVRSQRMLYRVRGSLALSAGARAIHLLSADTDDPDRRILCPLKTLYGPPPPALTFRITDGPRLEWSTQPPLVREPLVRESLLAPGPAGIPSASWNLSPDLLDLSPDARSALAEARDWLLDHLANGPRPANDVLRAARAADISGRTLRRAKRLCRVRSIKPVGSAQWLWSRDERPPKQDGQT